MADESSRGEHGFLHRWSQRKLAAARDAEAAAKPAPAADAPPMPPTPVEPAPAASGPVRADEAPPLPDPSTLTFDSDFTAFLSPDVEEGTRRAALRKLFSDPRFNAMDGLDVYIDDYSKFEPITPEVLKQLAHVRYLFDPPKTRINEHGHVEDVPDEPEAGAKEDEAAHDAAASPNAADPTARPPQAEKGTFSPSPASDTDSAAASTTDGATLDLPARPAAPAAPR